MARIYASMIMFPLIAFVLIFMTEYVIHTIYYDKVTKVSEFAVKTGENAGGITPEVIEKVEYRMHQENLDPEIFKFEHSNQPKVQWNYGFEVNVTGHFTYRAFNMIGTNLGNKTVLIESPNVGYSNVWFR